MNIQVEKVSDASYRVVVTPDDGIQTTHTVVLYPSYYHMLTQGTVTEEELITRFFEFLLKRETNTAIVHEFDLPDISNYFPEYEEYIRQKFNR